MSAVPVVWLLPPTIRKYLSKKLLHLFYYFILFLIIKMKVLSTVPVMFSYWAKPQDTLDLSQYLNDHLAQVVSENPKRFVGM